MDFIPIRKDEKHVKKERQKARELKNTRWWQDLLVKGICHYCGEKFKKNDLTMDHIVPLSRGGKSNRSNCVLSCDKCNKEKSVFTPVEIILNKINSEKKR